MHKVMCFILMLAGTFLFAECLRRGFVGFGLIGAVSAVAGLYSYIQEGK